MKARAEHRTELIAIIDQAFAAKPRHEWELCLARHELIWSVVSSIPEVAADTQVLDNGYITDWSHRQQQNVKGIGPLIGLSQSPMGIGEPAPELGQNTEEVLIEIGGYDWDGLTSLKDAGVII